MRVVVMRHGEAVGPTEAGSDGHRWLTREGRRCTRAVAGALEEAGIHPDHIFTSPLVRAAQTAEILAAGYGFSGPLSVWPALAGGTTAMALSALDEVGAEATAILVGHEPQVRSLVGHLSGAPTFFPFRTAGACLVEWSRGSGRLCWMLDPRSLERIASIEELTRGG